MNGQKNVIRHFKLQKEKLVRDPILYHPDQNTPWIIKTGVSKTAFAGILLQSHILDGIKQEVPVIFISYNFTGTQQAWSATERELYAIYVPMHKLSYMIKGGKVTIRSQTSLGDSSGNSQSSEHSSSRQSWTSDILAEDPHPTIEYKKGSLNLIANILSRLRTEEDYEHNTPLHSTEPIILKKKAEVNMVTSHAKSAEQEKLTPKLPDLQIRVRDILRTLDKCQLMMNAEKVFDSLDPV